MNTFTFLSGIGAAEIFFLILGLVIYFIPTIVAHSNRNKSTVVIINIFFGWTLLGWVIALILAYSESKEVVVHNNDIDSRIINGKADKYDQLEKLSQLRDKGVITPDEFALEKDKIMKS